MASRSSPTDPVPPVRSLGGLAKAADDCEACPLYKNVFETPFGRVMVTRHPSSVLRMQEQSERRAALQDLVEDLKAAAKLLREK